MTQRIAPSILSADCARLGDEVRAVVEAGADWMALALCRAGADTFVAGSAILGQPDYRAAIGALRHELAGVQRVPSAGPLPSRPAIPSGDRSTYSSDEGLQ